MGNKGRPGGRPESAEERHKSSHLSPAGARPSPLARRQDPNRPHANPSIRLTHPTTTTSTTSAGAQSDICHQSVYELVHSEDRDELTQQLRWNSMIVPAGEQLGAAGPKPSPLVASGSRSPSQMSLQEILASSEYIGPLGATQKASHRFRPRPRHHHQLILTQTDRNDTALARTWIRMQTRAADHRHLLERNFTVRFRCLLDNTSGFLVSTSNGLDSHDWPGRRRSPGGRRGPLPVGQERKQPEQQQQQLAPESS